MTYLCYGFTEAMNIMLGILGGHPQMMSGDRSSYLVRHLAGFGHNCPAGHCSMSPYCCTAGSDSFKSLPRAHMLKDNS